MMKKALRLSLAGVGLLVTIAPLQAALPYICKPAVKATGEDNTHALAEKRARINWRTQVIDQYGTAFLKHRAGISDGCTQGFEPRWRCTYRAKPCKDPAPGNSNVPVIKSPGIGTIR